MSKKRKPLLGGDRDKLADYIWSLAEMMGMGDWRIKLADAPPPEPKSGQAGGYCEIVGSRKYAIISIAPDWAEWPDWELRETVVHELLHGQLVFVQWATDAVVHSMTQVVYDTWHTSFTHALELSIDAIAVNWAKTLPLPIKAKEAA